MQRIWPYVLFVVLCEAGLAYGIFWWRDWARDQYAQSVGTSWHDWEDDAARQAAGQGPVTRRAVESHEPPAIVLMRDYFGASMVALLGSGALVFSALAFFIRAVFSGSSPTYPPAPE